MSREDPLLPFAVLRAGALLGVVHARSAVGAEMAATAEFGRKYARDGWDEIRGPSAES